MKIDININNDLNDREMVKQLVQQLYTAVGKKRSILDDLVQEMKHYNTHWTMKHGRKC
jgi:hypothetical protein